MEGGAFQSKKLARAGEDYVFVFLHQTREDSVASYKLITEEYLEEEFLHPAYIFLGPDGIEADKENRHHHVALSGVEIRKILEGIQKEWGKGLSVKDWRAAEAELKTASERAVAGEWDKARKTLEGLTRLRARCGVKDRATSMLATMDAREALVRAWRALEAPEQLRTDVEALLTAGDLPGAWRVLRKSTRDEPEARTAFREALEGRLRAFIRLKPLRMDRLFLGGRSYYYLRAEWETDLPVFDGLGFQISYLTDGEKSLEGHGWFDQVAPHRHHRAAVSLSTRELRTAEVVNGRFELWLGDLLLHSSLLKPEPKEFPKDTSHVLMGPDLLDPEETLGTGGRYQVRGYRLGRYPRR